MLDTACQFRTCRDVEIYPLVCDRVSAVHTKDASKVSLEMAMINKDDSVKSIELDSLRFYLGGDTYSAQNLYLWLGHYIDSIEVEYEGGSVKVPKDVFDVVGFDNDGLLPYPKNVYQGYRIFQEYLAFPESFHFFELKHIGRYIPDHVAGKFTIRFNFTQTLPGSTQVTSESFTLYATPIVNLFKHDADPIDLTGKRPEYRLSPSSRYPRHYEIFSVDHVEGWQETSDGRIRGQRRVYTPFESFQHEIELARKRLALYYRVRVKTAFARMDSIILSRS